MSNDRTYLAKLQDYYAQYRVLPSYATLSKLLGFTSKSSAAALVARFQRAGYLSSTPDKRLSPTRRFFERLIAQDPVRAGLPNPAGDGVDDALLLDGFLVEHPSETIMVRVKGDSMRDAGILEDDLVVVEKRHSASRGDIVVAIVDNQFTLKRLDQENGEYVLRPANPAYAPLRPQGQLEIIGVVVGLARKYK